MYLKLFSGDAEAGTPDYVLLIQSEKVVAWRGQPEVIRAIYRVAGCPHPVLSLVLGFEEELPVIIAQEIAEEFIRVLAPGISDLDAPRLIVIHAEDANHREGKRTGIHISLSKLHIGLGRVVNWLPGKGAINLLLHWVEAVNKHCNLRSPLANRRRLILPRKNFIIRLLKRDVEEIFSSNQDPVDYLDALQELADNRFENGKLPCRANIHLHTNEHSYVYEAKIGNESYLLGRVRRTFGARNRRPETHAREIEGSAEANGGKNGFYGAIFNRIEAERRKQLRKIIAISDLLSNGGADRLGGVSDIYHHWHVRPQRGAYSKDTGGISPIKDASIIIGR